MLMIFAVLLRYLSSSERKAWTVLEPLPLRCRCSAPPVEPTERPTERWGSSLESPETFRARFGWHSSLCIVKRKASQGTKLCSYFNFSPLEHMKRPALQDERIGVLGTAFRTEKFSGLSRSGPLVIVRINDKPVDSGFESRSGNPFSWCCL